MSRAHRPIMERICNFRRICNIFLHSTATKIDGTKITVQPGLSNGDRNHTNFNHQNICQEYDDYVDIEKELGETWIRKSERQGKCEAHDNI